MKTSKISTMAVAALALLFCAGTTQAALTWTSATNEAFNSTTWQGLSPGDTAIANFAIGSTSSGTVVWGDTWTYAGGGPTTLGGITVTLSGLGSAFTGYYSGGTPVLNEGRYNSVTPSTTAMYITLSGFDPNKEYILQFLQVDTRTNSPIPGRQGMMRELGTTNDSGIVVVGTANLDQTFGLIQGTFTGASSVDVQPLLSASGTPNWINGHINAIRVVEVIPEPASGLMLLGAVAGLGLLRKKIHG